MSELETIFDICEDRGASMPASKLCSGSGAPVAFLGFSGSFGLEEDIVVGEFVYAAIVFVTFFSTLLAGFVDQSF